MDTDLCLSSACAEDFTRLLDKNYNLDAAAAKDGYPNEKIPAEFLLRRITEHAAVALRDSGIKCLDVRSNLNLLKLPVLELCRISTLQQIKCSGCPNLLSLPIEVAENGGVEAMQFLREYVENGAENNSISLFFLGEGEIGKTSLTLALMNEENNTADEIGKDTRTVGMDMLDWHTETKQGAKMLFKIKDVGGQHVYMKLHELFVVKCAIYLYLWRADNDVEDTIQSSTKWLNLLQSCVPGVAVIPVVTHIDLVQTAEDLQLKVDRVQQALKEWQTKQNEMPGKKHARIVHVMDDGRSHKVNSLHGEGIADLRRILKEKAETTRGFREPLPQSWVALRDEIRSKGTREKYISWFDYVVIAKQCGIKDSMVLSVTSFLHETLELRFFGISSMRHQAENLDDFLTTILGERGADKNMRALFDQIDADNSGTIEKNELLRFMKDKGLSKPNIDAIMQSADENRSGKIELHEFAMAFENAYLRLKDSTLTTTVYLNTGWMVNILKGVVRHDHGALLLYLAEHRKKFPHLVLQARQLRVHGVISECLISGNYLWPGVNTAYWEKVANDEGEVYKYEKSLWDDGTGVLGKVVETERDRQMAMGLLLGFKIILALGTDDSEATSAVGLKWREVGPERTQLGQEIYNSKLVAALKRKQTSIAYFSRKEFVEFNFVGTLSYDNYVEVQDNETVKHFQPAGTDYFCPDLIPPHKKDTTDESFIRTTNASSGQFWHKCVYAELPLGFWNLLFMEIRGKVTSGSNSTFVHTFFLLSSKIQITLKTSVDLKEITVQSCTQTAFDTAYKALRRAQKFYAGMSLWRREDLCRSISDQERSGIEEHAQVLVMTAGSLVQKKDRTIANFKRRLHYDYADYKGRILPKNQADAALLDDNSRRNLDDFAKILDSIEDLRLRLTDASADQSTGFTSLDEVSPPKDLWLPNSITLGLKWAKTEAPAGKELEHPELAQALKVAAGLSEGQLFTQAEGLEIHFSQSEWSSFEIYDLRLNHYIESGHSNFTPAFVPFRKSLSLLGLKWIRSFRRPSKMSKKLIHRELQRALEDAVDQGRTSLTISITKHEWNKLGTIDLHSDHYVQSGGSYFVPLTPSIEMPSSWRAFGNQVEKLQSPFSQPTSRILHLPEEEFVADNYEAEWIDTLFSAMDEYFSKFGGVSREIFSPRRRFHGKALVLLVLLDETTSSCSELCTRFDELERQGCQVIGVPMPGYEIQNFSRWWPEEMTAFERHTLFFDCRSGRQWGEKMHRELMPQLRKLLEESTERIVKPEDIDTQREKGCGSQGPVPGALQEEIFVSKDQMRESILPCPRCLKLEYAHPGGFTRDDCMLHFSYDIDSSKGILYCRTCQQNVKATEILKRPIFLSYQWGYQQSTQKIARHLCEKVFVETEMPYWLDIVNGMGLGDELIKAMREGVEDCQVAILNS